MVDPYLAVAHFKCSDGEVAVTAVAFSADGGSFVTAVGDGTATLWSTYNWSKVAQVSTATVTVAITRGHCYAYAAKRRASRTAVLVCY